MWPKAAYLEMTGADIRHQTDMWRGRRGRRVADGACSEELLGGGGS